MAASSHAKSDRRMVIFFLFVSAIGRNIRCGFEIKKDKLHVCLCCHVAVNAPKSH